MIKIIIADDHIIVRKGLKMILDETSDFKVVDEASTGSELLMKLEKNKFDVVVLDISMPGRDGIDTLKEIKKNYPKLPVLVLSVHSEEHYAMRALKAGAAGYINKDSATDTLVEAIRKISAGRKHISQFVAEKLAFELEDKKSDTLHDELSDREFQVLCMISNGKTLTDIAEELSLSVKTVSTYRTRILEKMQLKNNAELTHYSVRNNLID